MFPKISNKLDLDFAADQVIINSRTDFILDKLGIELLKNFKDEYTTYLKDKLTKCEDENIDYEPMDLVTIDVPKKDFTLRPGAVPDIIDRIYYQSLCNAIAPTIESNLTPYEDKVLFSYRLNKKSRDKYMFIDPHDAYRNFVLYQNELCECQEFTMVLETDVADYFQRIYHHELFNLLKGFRCDEDVIVCLFSLLRKWRKGNSYGIPQSMWPSHLLGNVYLHELDKIMTDKYKYLRYVDDIIVFCQSEVDAKTALMEICKLIRILGLNVQSAKTRIRDKDSFYSRIRPFSEKINDFIENNKIVVEFDWYFSEFFEVVLPEEELYIARLDEIFASAIEATPNDEIAIKFCLGAYAYTRRPNAADFCVNNLAELPHLSSYFVNYLTSLEPDDSIAENILEFLKSKNNIYQWQEMWLLRYFFKIDRLNTATTSYLKRIFLDGNKHVASRSIAAQLLGRNGDLIDMRLLKNNFGEIASPWIKRSIIYALKDLTKSERNQVYNYWRTQNWYQDLCVQYAKKVEIQSK